MKQDRRYGKFTVSVAVFEGPFMGEILAAMKLVPLRIDSYVQMDAVELTGRSPYFNRLPEGEVVPHYRVTVHEKSGKIEGIAVEKT